MTDVGTPVDRWISARIAALKERIAVLEARSAMTDAVLEQFLIHFNQTRGNEAEKFSPGSSRLQPPVNPVKD